MEETRTKIASDNIKDREESHGVEVDLQREIAKRKSKPKEEKK